MAMGLSPVLSGVRAQPVHPEARYHLIDLSRDMPSGFNTPTPITVNDGGEVAGEVYSGSAPSTPIAGYPRQIVLRHSFFRSAGPSSSVGHVFIYDNGRFTVLKPPPGAAQTFIAGLNDAGSLAVVTCDANQCNRYFVVHPFSGTFVWTRLTGPGAGSLGGIAANGDVTGALPAPSRPHFDLPVVWKAGRAGSYSRAWLLGTESGDTKAYIPDAIWSHGGKDIEGGVENVVNFYPEGHAVLWGPKLATDRGYIGSQTMALGGSSSVALAAVGCPLPLPGACGPNCPVDPVVYHVSISSAGTPKVSDKAVLASPPKNQPHCGVSPYDVTLDPGGEPVTVGQASMLVAKRDVPRALVWFGTRVVALNAIAGAPKTDLQSANAINDHGCIAGTGTIAGRTNRAFLLEPVGGW